MVDGDRDMEIDLGGIPTVPVADVRMNIVLYVGQSEMPAGEKYVLREGGRFKVYVVPGGEAFSSSIFDKSPFEIHGPGTPEHSRYSEMWGNR